jgi:2-polyprenyl-3-methyl-5-hydroxy-6-metoxy-1,4-benzoquinol methylase
VIDGRQTGMEGGPIRLETVPHCPVCNAIGAPFHQEVVDRLCHVPGRWSFLRCPTDGNLWLSPRPIDEDLSLCYPEGYFTHAVKPPERKRRSQARSLKETFRRSVLASKYCYRHLSPGHPSLRAAVRLVAWLPPVAWEVTHHLGACLPPYRSEGRLLDVGCGNGAYLARMQGYGWEVAGVEVDAAAAAVAQEEHGLNVHVGPVEGAPFPEGSFDVITGQHVLEHIAGPQPFLRSVARFLKPQGRLVIVTPNARSLGHAWFRRDCYSLDPPRHLVLYTTDSLRTLVDQTPELRLISLRTHARIARKIFLQRRVLRQCASFRGSNAQISLGDRLGALLFSYAESIAALFSPVGEEIELVVTRQG